MDEAHISGDADGVLRGRAPDPGHRGDGVDRQAAVAFTLRSMKDAKNRTNIIAIVGRAVIALIKRSPRRPRPDDSGQKIDPYVYKDSKKGLPAGTVEMQRSYLHSPTRHRR